MLADYERGFFAFQSTHPVRGATNRSQHGPLLLLDFNPRTP